MNYRTLGSTNVEVSEIGFGALGIGSAFYGPKDRSESLRAIKRALDLGVNYFDTCPSYGDSEEILGEALSGERDRVVVATKVQTRGFGSVEASVDYSLGRLKTDYVDVLQLRDPTPEKVETLDVMDSFARLKEKGKIRFGSVTVGDGSQAEQSRYAIESGFDTIQLAYNLIFRAAEESLPLAKEAGVGIVGRGPLCKGFLASRIQSIPEEKRERGSFSQFSIEEAETLIKIQNELAFLVLPGERTLAQAAVQFVLRQDAVSTIIPSMDQVEEVEDLCGAAEAPQVTDDEIERALAVIQRNAPVEY